MSSFPNNMGAASDVGVAELGFMQSSAEEDALMMDRPFLDYINNMLMDEEAMEECPLVQQDRISYQAIVSGFYDIIGEPSAPVTHSNGGLVYDDISGESLPPLQSSSDSGNGSMYEPFELLQSCTPGKSGNLYDIFHEQSTLSFSSQSLKALTDDSGSSDERFRRLDSSGVVDSFYNIYNECSPFVQSLHASNNLDAFTSVLGTSKEFVRLDSPDLPDYEHNWINHIMNLSSPGPPDIEYGRVNVSHATPVVAAHDNSSNEHSISSAEELLDGHVSFVKNKDLDLEADYARLYVGSEGKHPYDSKQHIGPVEDGRHHGQASNRKINASAHEKPRNRHVKGKKGAVVQGMSGNHKGKRNGKSDACISLDMKELLVSCAQAVAAGDTRRAEDTLQQLRNSGASADGNGLHRTLHYFCKALEARMQGTGSRAYIDAKYKNRPSLAGLLKALKVGFSSFPHTKVAHYFANQSILKAAEGATHLHIVDYGIFCGLQWPCLINALADRKGGPPKLVMTGIEFPQPGSNPAEGLEDIGRRLTEYANTYKVPFEYRAIAASNWEDVNPISEEDARCAGKVLVINCMNRLQNVLDEGVNASGSFTGSHRQQLLETFCNLKPDLFVVAVLNANHNSPFFVSRFRDALNYYSYKFDMMDTIVAESPERRIIEEDCMYRDLLNVIACEGVERVERPETCRQWQARFQRAGFEHVPIMPAVLSMSKSLVQNYYHKEFNVDQELNGWMIMSWKGRSTQAVSAWKPRAS